MGYEKQSILDNYELGGIVGEGRDLRTVWAVKWVYWEYVKTLVQRSLVVGSYGTVHKAKNKETGRYVAIKKFIEDDQTTLKIAHREVRSPTRILRR